MEKETEIYCKKCDNKNELSLAWIDFKENEAAIKCDICNTQICKIFGVKQQSSLPVFEDVESIPLTFEAQINKGGDE